MDDRVVWEARRRGGVLCNTFTFYICTSFLLHQYPFVRENPHPENGAQRRLGGGGGGGGGGAEDFFRMG
jgi:hypothetical protein